MAFAVQRTSGKYGRDFLHAWCNEWGTSCMGSASLAMKFETLEQADLAAAQAQRACKGRNGLPAVGVSFKAVRA